MRMPNRVTRVSNKIMSDWRVLNWRVARLWRL